MKKTNQLFKLNINRTIIQLIILFFSITTFAQKKIDSIQKKTAIGIKEKFPRTRILNFEYGQSLQRDFDSELLEEALQKGVIKKQETFNASLNLPFYFKGKLVLSGALNYQYNKFEFENIQNTNVTVFEQNGVVDFHNFSTAINATYFSSLFKKPVIYNASVIIDGNEKGFERIKGLVGFSFILKRTASTTMTLGAIAFLDPTAQLPFFPTFSYSHKFSNSKWELDFILPQRLLLRRFVGENGRFSIGSSFGASSFYINVDSPEFAEIYEYSQLEVRSGITYEHRFNNHLIGTFQGGVQNFIGNRLTEKAKPNSEFIYKNNQDATGYFQFGISIDPFAKKKQVK
tara:strand:- start:607 stop:1638 length:1032 start_codon:yes stop_codon:yes gene_type:complete